MLKFGCKILSHSCLKYDISCSTVQGLHRCILRFKMHQTIKKVERPHYCDVQNIACHCLTRLSWGAVKDIIWMAAYVSQRPFSINGVLTDVQFTHAMGTYTPPHHHRCRLLNFALIKIWMVLFLFRSQCTFPLCFSLS